MVEATAELEALVDALEARWHQEAQAGLEPEIEQVPVMPAPRLAPEPQAQAEAEQELGTGGRMHNRRPAEAGPDG